MTNKIIIFIQVDSSLVNLYVKKHSDIQWKILDNVQDYIKYSRENLIIQVSHNWQVPLELRFKAQYIYEKDFKISSGFLEKIFYYSMFYKNIL